MRVVDSQAGWRPLRPPLGDPAAAVQASPFSRLALAHALSVAGDTFVTMALAGSLFFNISPNEARSRVALSLLLTMAPFAVVAPFLGPVIDRVRGGRRFTVVGASLARAATAIVMSATLDELVLFPVAFASLVLSKAHAVAKSSLVPTVVDDAEGLVEANAKLALGSVVVGLVTGLPGLAVLRFAGADWVVRLAAITFAVAAVAAMRIVQVHPDGREPAPTTVAALRSAGIRLAATSMGVLRGAVGFLTFLVAFGLRREAAPSWVFGAVLAANMAGGFLGTLVAPAARRKVSEERILIASLAAVAVAAVAAARIGGRPAAALFASVLGMSASAGKLAFDSLVQRDAGAAVQGRQFARFEAEFQLAWVAGALAPVLVAVPLRIGFFVLALAGTTAAVLYATGHRATRPPPP